MANKARFYKVTQKDGHGSRSDIIPAHSKKDLLLNLHLSEHVKLENVEHLGFLKVYAEPNEDKNGVVFKAEVDEKTETIDKHSTGYSFLVHQFPEQVEEIDKLIEDENS